MFDPPPDRIIWCYGMYPKNYNVLRDTVEFTDGIPDPESFTGDKRTILVLDDMMHSLDSRIDELFTKVSHHRSVSIIYITQNLFFGKQQRTISLNSHYFILFRNIRDSSQIGVLARQMYPSRSGYDYFMESYKDATGMPFGYLVVDLRPETEDKFRLRTGVLPNQSCYVYVRK